jgi:undecaprenyl-diphosphatase
MDFDRGGGQRARLALAATWRSLVRPRRASAPRAWTPLMSWILLAGLAAVAAAHLVDDSAVLFVRSSDSRAIRLMAEVTNVGKSQWYLVPAGLAFLGIAGLDWKARDRSGRSRLAFLFSQAGFAFLAIAVAGLIGNLAKFLIGRARPKLFDAGGSLHFDPFTAGYDFNSFPSGHSITMGAAAMVLMLWFPRWRLPAAVLCGLAALTRIAALAHYPSDVVAGFLTGTLYALYLSRWLAARGVAFRFRAGALLPAPRFRLAARKVRAGRGGGRSRA